MIDRLFAATRLDFQQMLARTAITYKKSLTTLTVLVLFVATVNIFTNMMPINLEGAINKISEHEYEISNGTITLDENEREDLNRELMDDGFFIEESKIQFGKKETISYQQLLQLKGKNTLTSEEVSRELNYHTKSISQLIFFYFFLKELIIVLWTIILAIVLTRTTQKYLRQRIEFSFTKTFDCVSSLVMLPLFTSLVLNVVGVLWTTRLFFFTMVYTILAFTFARYTLNHQKVDEERND